MSKLYSYVGPAELLNSANAASERFRVTGLGNFIDWLVKRIGQQRGTLTLTFVILSDGLWVADQRSEHVACARGGSVFSAGEMTLEFDCAKGTVSVTFVTNQSTGYCPEPESWQSVEDALNAVGISHPEAFSIEMIFRHCKKCGNTNLVKDNWFVCEVCKAELPREWNFSY